MLIQAVLGPQPEPETGERLLPLAAPEYDAIRVRASAKMLMPAGRVPTTPGVVVMTVCPRVIFEHTDQTDERGRTYFG
jgi:hypothetical protein